MHAADLLFHRAGFAYDGAPTPLFDDLELHFPAGWTGIVGANGAGKTTLLRLAVGELAPTRGRVIGAGLYCPQRTDAAPDGLDDFLLDMDAEACRLRGRLRVDDDWGVRWESLSHGERKRAQVGVALWRQPAALAIDEPTNHLDAQARHLLVEALRRYDGVGLLVSHDRALLDELCRQCAFVEPPAVQLRPGGYSQGAEQARQEREAARQERQVATRQVQQLQREVSRRRAEAARSDARRSKKGLGKDNDARAKRNLARVSGKDGQAGRLLTQLSGRAAQARQRRDEIRVVKEHDLGIWVAGQRSHRDRLLARDAGDLRIADGRRLRHPALHLGPADRVALTGANGAGKSTLLRALLADAHVEPERLVYLPQEIDVASSRAILAAARQRPGDELGRLMTVVSCLNSRSERLLDSALPSPGEVRKLLLADGIARRPHLIVMDEPTNHLDLPSIECLERALAGCPCALLLVSHDEAFLGALTSTRWRLDWQDDAGGDAVLTIDACV